MGIQDNRLRFTRVRCESRYAIESLFAKRDKADCCDSRVEAELSEGTLVQSSLKKKEKKKCSSNRDRRHEYRRFESNKARREVDETKCMKRIFLMEKKQTHLLEDR